MSGFILTKGSAVNNEAFENSRNAFRKKSYRLIEHQMNLGEYHFAYYDDLFKSNTKIYQNDEGEVFYYAGYFSYDGKTGSEALIAVKNSLDKNLRLENLDFHGNFFLLTFYKGVISITRDLFGTYGCYTNKEQTWFTSDNVAAMYLNGKHSFRKFELFENILFGMEFGLQTLIDGIYLLDPTQIHLPITNTTLQRKIKIPALEHNYKKCVESNAATLLEQFSLYHKFFKSSITSALTGGFDSRLMLAAEMHCGITPDLYVYGLKDDKDVSVAKDICSHEKLALFHAERYADKVHNTDAARDVILQNFWDFDGSNQLFAGKFNLDSRMEKANSHLLVLNGAGGEIYRDQWKWDFKTKSLYELIKNSYDTGELGALGLDEKAFFENIEHKLYDQIKHFGFSKHTVTRQQAEIIFPIYRSNFYYRGNNVNNYFGNATLPYMTQSVILQSLSIPYHFKRSGRFEADLIKIINPVLASYNSEYGFNFNDGPSAKAKFMEWGYAKLNPSVKAKVKAAMGSSKKSIFKKFKENNVYLSQPVAEKLINLDNLGMGAIVPGISKIKNQNILNRIYSLEIMANQVLN